MATGTQNYPPEVANEIDKSIRDMLSLKMTLPLGNPALKLVHTNQFLWCPLPDEFDVENFEYIANELSGRETRYGKYEKGRWYIEGVTINNDGSKFTMELELNPFASSTKEYSDKRNAFAKAYQDALNSQNSESGSGGDVKSTGNSTLKGGQGTVIDNLVKDICGNITDELQRCKAIHEWLKKNVRYGDYECCKYCTPEKAYNNRSHINCADTAVLTCSMMLSAGLNAYIVHRTYNGGHFWTIIEIGGKKYASDQTGDGSEFNTVWSRSGRANTSITDYSHKEEGLHTC